MVEDIPHLSVNLNPSYESVPDTNHFNIVKGNNVKAFDEVLLSTLIKKFNKPTTWTLHAMERPYEFRNEHYEQLIENNSWMTDETVSLLIKWLDCVKNYDPSKQMEIVSSISVAVLVSHVKTYKTNEKDTNELQNLIEKYRRTLKIDGHDVNKKYNHNVLNSDCIFLVNNLDKNHWNLVCFCNMKTINSNFIDLDGIETEGNTEIDIDDEAFDNYALPCILVFDSLSQGTITSDTLLLIEGFRLWLTNDREINTNGYTFSETNLPATMVESTQQQDGSSCGYFAIRNLIGMLISYEIIFPIRIKNTNKKAMCIGKETIAKYY